MNLNTSLQGLFEVSVNALSLYIFKQYKALSDVVLVTALYKFSNYEIIIVVNVATCHFDLMFPWQRDFKACLFQYFIFL